MFKLLLRKAHRKSIYIYISRKAEVKYYMIICVATWTVLSGQETFEGQETISAIVDLF